MCIRDSAEGARGGGGRCASPGVVTIRIQLAGILFKKLEKSSSFGRRRQGYVRVCACIAEDSERKMRVGEKNKGVSPAFVE